MDVKLALLFLIISTIIGLSNYADDERSESALVRAYLKAVARVRRLP